MSQSYNLCELRIYIAAESNRNGVVGSTGRKMPITPNTSDTLPKNAKRNFIVLNYRREGTKKYPTQGMIVKAVNIFPEKKCFLSFFSYIAHDKRNIV